MLVVIAIIGVLAAITLATVSSVRGKATQVRCISNLRQLGIATSMFMMENRNTYPQVNYWPKDIVPHLSVAYENVNSLEIKVVGSLASNPYTCPAAISSPDTLFRGQFGYAINADGLAGFTPEKVVDPKNCPVALQGAAAGKTQLLSQTILYADAINYPNHLYRSPDRVPDRHQSKVNVVFADFHAAPVRYAPESDEWKLMFFGFK
ncbi:hypothetical protein OPIT5_09680 [Opitutaceae bacterium TAV5]|nr:hypothetical protein OPIT5_09680 [Opitutaceae bacterium TAV5]